MDTKKKEASCGRAEVSEPFGNGGAGTQSTDDFESAASGIDGEIEAVLDGCESADSEVYPRKATSDLTSLELGRVGEEIAVRHLERLGYEIVQRNYRCREGEADIVAYDPGADAVVLVEVKTRRAPANSRGLYPEEAVDGKKRKRYRRIAACFLMENFPVPSIRFDVVAVTVTGDRTAHVRHILAAFDWDSYQ